VKRDAQIQRDRRAQTIRQPYSRCILEHLISQTSVESRKNQGFSIHRRLLIATYAKA
jgi:hypothetical protein